MKQGKTVTVALGQRSYPVWIRENSLSRAGESFRKIPGLSTKGIVVTNRRVFSLHGRAFMKSLRAAGWDWQPVYVPDGERAKTLHHAQAIYRQMLRWGCNRQSVVAALGGGVVGDLAGFVAATFMRGVPFIQVPTTLLAQVDSSVGGKVAVNLPEGKNLVGAFYQPRAVLVDPACLSTLPEKEFRCGMAEVIKYGLIQDPAHFQYLDKNAERIRALDPSALVRIIERSVRIKADVVAQDEREAGLRAILNFGHTFGHAIEKTWQYKTYTHGEAVAIGMRMAGDVSCLLGHLDPAVWAKARTVFGRFGLRETLPCDGRRLRAVYRNLFYDKKRKDKGLELILMKDVGHVFQLSLDEPRILERYLRRVHGAGGLKTT